MQKNESSKKSASQSNGDKLAKLKVMTPTFRVSYPAVFQPKKQDDGSEKYGVVMLFSKDADLKAMRIAARRAGEEKWGAKESWPKNVRMPFRDGDEKSDKEGYEGHIFVSARANKRPGIVDGKLSPILDESDFYAGCYARATLIAFAYDTKGNKGISFSLLNLQKVKDGESLAGRRNAADEFDAIDGGESDGESDFDPDEL